MNRDQNLAPLLRKIAIAAVLLTGLPLLALLRHIARTETTPALISMGVVAAVMLVLLAALNSQWAKNAVVKLPEMKKKDRFVT